jgi:hypothetical protein
MNTFIKILASIYIGIRKLGYVKSLLILGFIILLLAVNSKVNRSHESDLLATKVLSGIKPIYLTYYTGKVLNVDSLLSLYHKETNGTLKLKLILNISSQIENERSRINQIEYPIFKAKTDSINRADNIKRIAVLSKTPKGQLMLNHPEWSDYDCQRIVNNEVWIGMSLSQLELSISDIRCVNISDYGSGKQYRFTDGNSFYYTKEDFIVYAYN